MVDIVGKTIYLTRGDTLRVTIGIKQRGTDNAYQPQAGDVVRFSVKRNYNETETLISKIVPNDTLILELNPSDTKNLAFGNYVYDIELTYANGDVDTFIAKATLVITEEVG